MESTNQNPKEGVGAVSPQAIKVHRCSIECSIRLKPNLVGVPGQDPAERSYKIGASLDRRSQGNLKGITGELEALFMPEIVAYGANAPEFRRAVDEYWSNISKVIPPDEPFLKDHKKGVPLTIRFTLSGDARKERFDKTIRAEDKVNLLNAWLVEKTESGKAVATLEVESTADYLLLNYCLKYPAVANNFADVDKSPRIYFYIYEKAVAVVSQQSDIELRRKAMTAYTALEDNENKINAVLLHFGENLSEFDTVTDKLLRIDEIYNSSKSKLAEFVKVAEDKNWEVKSLIRAAINKNKLKQPANSTLIYYNDTLLGTDMDEAVLFLNTSEKGKEIKSNISKEIAVK